jgi:uncharacterized C2H2 Zn-finger protein
MEFDTSFSILDPDFDPFDTDLDMRLFPEVLPEARTPAANVVPPAIGPALPSPVAPPIVPLSTAPRTKPRTTDRSRALGPGTRPRRASPSPEDHRGILKKCPYCPKFQQSRNFARHVKSHGKTASASLSKLGAVAKAKASSPKPLTRSKTLLSDHDLARVADVMIRVRNEFGADVEGLCISGRTSEPRVSDEALRAMAIGIQRFSTHTRQLARELSSEAGFRTTVAKLATTPLMESSATPNPVESLDLDEDDPSTPLPPLDDIPNQAIPTVTPTPAHVSNLRSCVVLLGDRCHTSPVGNEQPGVDTHSLDRSSELAIPRLPLETSPIPRAPLAGSSHPVPHIQTSERKSNRPVIFCKSRSPEILPGDDRVFEFTSRAHTKAVLETASRRLAGWEARRMFASAEQQRVRALKASKEILRMSRSTPAANDPRPDTASSRRGTQRRRPRYRQPVPTLSSSTRVIPRLLDLVFPVPDTARSASAEAQVQLEPLSTSAPSWALLSVNGIEQMDSYWTAEGVRNAPDCQPNWSA